MKKFLFLSVFAAALAGAGWYFFRRADSPGVTDRARDLAGRTRQTAVEVKDQAADSARELGGYLGDVGIITLLKGKYAAEKDLSALAITIECRDGHVTLRGSVESAEHIARAVTLARQTKGVTGINSLLTVKN